MNARATAGDITDTGILTVTGTSTFTVAGGQSIILGSDGGTFTGAVTFATSSGTLLSVEINDSNAFEIQELTVTQDLTVTAGDDITDSDTITVGRNLVATTDDNNGEINLDTLRVDGTIALTTNDAANN
ncbi:uncharacterized protein METZ01_LOCUS225603, partial [marine metagenome]